MTGKLKLDDRKWKKLLATIGGVDRAHVKVGVLGDQGGDAPAGEDGDLTLVDIARLHEYGDPESGLEERSFVRRTMIEQAAKIGAFQGKLCGLLLQGKLNITRALELLGAMAAGEVKLTITSGSVTPALAQSTIDAKGSSKPLIDTSQLVNNISFQVVSA